MGGGPQHPQVRAARRQVSQLVELGSMKPSAAAFPEGNGEIQLHDMVKVSLVGEFAVRFSNVVPEWSLTAAVLGLEDDPIEGRCGELDPLRWCAGADTPSVAGWCTGLGEGLGDSLRE
jgi:hypothetical protein